MVQEERMGVCGYDVGVPEELGDSKDRVKGVYIYDRCDCVIPSIPFQAMFPYPGLPDLVQGHPIHPQYLNYFPVWSSHPNFRCLCYGTGVFIQAKVLMEDGNFRISFQWFQVGIHVRRKTLGKVPGIRKRGGGNLRFRVRRGSVWQWSRNRSRLWVISRGINLMV
jgi:hypothetical protein